MVNPDEVMRQIRQYDICKCALNLVFFFSAKREADGKSDPVIQRLFLVKFCLL